MSIVVTGATGQLGRQIVASLVQKVSPAQIIVAVRSPDKAEDLKALGVTVRQADYSDPASLESAFAGASKVLLISSNDFAQRVSQHTNVVTAAKKANVTLLAYTSILHAETSPMLIASDHKETEHLIRASGLSYVFLRNGWYTENFVGSIHGALQHGALVGSAGEGKFSSAAVKDYAEAAAVVLADPIEAHAGKIYELGGDTAHTLADVAALVSSVTGRTIPYVNLPEAELAQVLVGAGLPEGFARVLANSDVCAAEGSLFSGDGQLGRLIGRPTTDYTVVLTKALQQKKH